jgi:CHASE2 domain-containing sensor protein
MRSKQLREKRAQRKAGKLLRLREGFWKRLLRALPVLLLTLLLTLLLIRGDTLHEFAADSQDLLTRLSAPTKDSRVAVVMIGDAEYEKEFNKDGALNPAKLQELIGALAKGNAKLIAVDIDTSDARYRNYQFNEFPTPIVWVRGVYDLLPEVLPTPREVLGGQKPELNNAPHSGLPLLYDVNHVTRLYQRITQTTEGDQLSFPWAVATRIDPLLTAQRQVTTDHLMINFPAAPSEELSASQILAVANDPIWPRNDKIRNKIVLIGVSYEGQDRHETPLGNKHGVYNMAAAIETELDGGGIKQPSEFTFLPLWILQSLGLIILFGYFPLHLAFWKNLGWSMALVAGSSVLCSLIAMLVAPGPKINSALVYLVYFLPVGLFVFVEQLREVLDDWRKEKLAQVSGQITHGPSKDSGKQ